MVVRPQWTPSPSDPMTQPFSSVSEASRPWPSSAAIAHGATQGIPWRLSEWRSDRPIRDSLDASPGGGGRDGLTGVGFSAALGLRDWSVINIRLIPSRPQMLSKCCFFYRNGRDFCRCSRNVSFFHHQSARECRHRLIYGIRIGTLLNKARRLLRYIT